MVERRCSTGSSSMIRMRSRNDVTTDDNSQLRILPERGKVCQLAASFCLTS